MMLRKAVVIALAVLMGGCLWGCYAGQVKYKVTHARVQLPFIVEHSQRFRFGFEGEVEGKAEGSGESTPKADGENEETVSDG